MPVLLKRCLATLLAIAALPAAAEVRLLGEVTIRCDAREIRIKGSPDTRIPPGKYEWVRVAVPRDIVDYDCGTRRRSVFCRLDTDFVRVRRTGVPDLYRMECWGDPPLLVPLEGGPADGADAAGEGSGAGAEGSPAAP